jgi:predicted porin
MNKKILIGSITCTLCIVSLNALAASSLTLYGTIGAGVQYVSNSVSAAKWGFVSTGETTNRWGLQGSEDLGGSLKAIFSLENGFYVGTGQFGATGTEFNRRAFMGLTSDRYGSLTFGRQYAASTDLLEIYGPALVPIGTYPGDITDMDNGVRMNNSVKYRTPTIGGLTGVVVYGFSNAAGHMGNGSAFSAGVNYVRDHVVAGATYYRTSNDLSGAGLVSVGIPSGNAVSAGFGRSASQQTVNAVAGAKFDAGYVGLIYGYTQYRPSALSFTPHSEAFNAIGAVGMLNVTPAAAVALTYSYTVGQSVDTASETDKPKYHQIAARLFYSLSKRSGLYAVAGFQHASGTTLNSAGALVDAAATVGDALNGAESHGRNQLLIRTGFYTRF